MFAIVKHNSLAVMNKEEIIFESFVLDHSKQIISTENQLTCDFSREPTMSQIIFTQDNKVIILFSSYVKFYEIENNSLKEKQQK